MFLKSAIMTWAIETQNLGMIFRTNWGGKKRALENLDLKVEENEIFGFLGPNGAGKTTTIKILLALCHPTEGNAKIFGHSTQAVSARKLVGFLPENISFYEYLTGLETVEFYARLHGISRRQSRKNAHKILEQVGLQNAARRFVREYSKGMKQRLGLAQAMIHRPQLLILDEPLSGLDPIGRREFRESLRILKEQGKTIFFSSHVLTDVELLCDRVGLLANGKLITVGQLDLLLNPQTTSIEIIGEGFSNATLDEIKPLCTRMLIREKITAVWVNTEKHAYQVKNLLERDNGTLRAFIPHKESLEDFYLRWTKGEHR